MSERLEKLSKDLVFGHFSAYEFRVVFGGVDSTEVGDCDFSCVVFYWGYRMAMWAYEIIKASRMRFSVVKLKYIFDMINYLLIVFAKIIPFLYQISGMP